MGLFARFILLPIIFVIGRVFRGINWLFFGWWLDPRLKQKLDGRLAQEIREKLPFLFSEYGAHFVPTESRYPRVMDAAVVTVEAGNLRLLFLTGRGDLTVRIAPRHAPSDWHELQLVAKVIETPQGVGGPLAPFIWLDNVAQLLRTHWSSLNEALSIEHYALIQQRLGAIYDLSGDDLWNAGVTIPKHLRTGPPTSSDVRRRR
jgi:hypothetical protein